MKLGVYTAVLHDKPLDEAQRAIRDNISAAIEIHGRLTWRAAA